MDEIWHGLACHPRQQIPDRAEYRRLEYEQAEGKDRERPHPDLDADLLPDKRQWVMQYFP